MKCGRVASTHAVTEFRQVAFLEKPTQFPKASGLLGNLHSQHGLPFLTQFSAPQRSEEYRSSCWPAGNATSS